MVIKMETIDGAHAANAISYVLDKEKARKENKPVFLAANNIELNPLTGKPYSPVEVLMDMQLLQAASKHRAENPFWRIELCPPKEECRDWTMEQWDRFCRDCVTVLDSTDYKTEVMRAKNGQPVFDKRTGRPKVKVSGKRTMLAGSQYIATVHFDTGKPHVHIVANRLTMDGQMQATHLLSIVDQLNVIANHTNEELPHRYQALLAQLAVGYEFLNYYRREQDRNWTETRNVEIFNHFCDLVVKHYRESREVKYYADLLNLTPKHLSIVIRTVANISPAEWIEQYVTAQAKRLIETRATQTLQETAYMLGFSEPTSFYRYFKRVTGMTAKHYRDSNPSS